MYYGVSISTIGLVFGKSQGNTVSAVSLFFIIYLVYKSGVGIREWAPKWLACGFRVVSSGFAVRIVSHSLSLNPYLLYFPSASSAKSLFVTQRVYHTNETG